MPRFLRIFPLLFAGWQLSAETLYQVTFKAVTAFGGSVPMRVAGLGDPLHHRDLTPNCRLNVCKDVPEGPYNFVVVLNGTERKVEGQAVVYRTNQIVLVDVGTPEEDLDDSNFPDITGRLSGAPDSGDLWVKLQPLYSDTSVSARVNPDGTFKIDDVRPGNWMLLVFDDGRLVHFQPFTCQVRDNPPLRIRLTRKGTDVVKVSDQPSSPFTPAVRTAVLTADTQP
jgi:hypothetical protein